MTPIRILHSVSNMDRAGLETVRMSYYRHMDRDLVQFDFLCNKKKPGAYDDEIRSMGGHIFVTPGLNPIKYPQYLRYMTGLFQKYPYRIIEGHNETMAVYALHAARVNGVPIRICHAHNTSIGRNWKLPIRYVCKLLLPGETNYRFSVGTASAEYYFGKNAVEGKDYEIVYNAIDVDEYKFNRAFREKLRKQHGLEDKHVIGHVGRFSPQKNHRFLFEVFEEVIKQDPKAYLVLLGDGDLFDKMKELAAKKGLSDRIYFAGNVGNANEWYSVFDVFVLPSLYEGLPGVAVQAQANDLPCIFSENVTREIDISDRARFLSLNAPKSVWAKALLSGCRVKTRRDNTDLMTRNHYNIEYEAKKMQQRYLELYEIAEKMDRRGK